MCLSYKKKKLPMKNTRELGKIARASAGSRSPGRVAVEAHPGQTEE